MLVIVHFYTYEDLVQPLTYIKSQVWGSYSSTGKWRQKDFWSSGASQSSKYGGFEANETHSQGRCCWRQGCPWVSVYMSRKVPDRKLLWKRNTCKELKSVTHLLLPRFPTEASTSEKYLIRTSQALCKGDPAIWLIKKIQSKSGLCKKWNIAASEKRLLKEEAIPRPQ